jgi:hypothetical protein
MMILHVPASPAQVRTTVCKGNGVEPQSPPASTAEKERGVTWVLANHKGVMRCWFL